MTPEQQRVAAKLVDQQPGKHTTAHYQAAADKVAGKSKKEQASEKPDEQDDDKPRVTSYTPDKPVEPQVKTTNQPKDNDGLEKLMELLDEAETQARKIGGCDDVVKALHELSKVITKKLNGGAK